MPVTVQLDPGSQPLQISVGKMRMFDWPQPYRNFIKCNQFIFTQLILFAIVCIYISQTVNQKVIHLTWQSSIDFVSQITHLEQIFWGMFRRYILLVTCDCSAMQWALKERKKEGPLYVEAKEKEVDGNWVWERLGEWDGVSVMWRKRGRERDTEKKRESERGSECVRERETGRGG